jgi:hypothetical protein
MEPFEGCVAPTLFGALFTHHLRANTHTHTHSHTHVRQSVKHAHWTGLPEFQSGLSRVA